MTGMDVQLPNSSLLSNPITDGGPGRRVHDSPISPESGGRFADRRPTPRGAKTRTVRVDSGGAVRSDNESIPRRAAGNTGGIGAGESTECGGADFAASWQKARIPHARAGFDRFRAERLSAAVEGRPPPTSPWRKSPLHSTGDASRLTALFVGCIYPICALLTPCQAGASPLSVQRGVPPRAATPRVKQTPESTCRSGVAAVVYGEAGRQPGHRRRHRSSS